MHRPLSAAWGGHKKKVHLQGRQVPLEVYHIRSHGFFSHLHVPCRRGLCAHQPDLARRAGRRYRPHPPEGATACPLAGPNLGDCGGGGRRVERMHRGHPRENRRKAPPLHVGHDPSRSSAHRTRMAGLLGGPEGGVGKGSPSSLRSPHGCVGLTRRRGHGHQKHGRRDDAGIPPDRHPAAEHKAKAFFEGTSSCPTVGSKVSMCVLERRMGSSTKKM